jgi:hypothetical protein
MICTAEAESQREKDFLDAYAKAYPGQLAPPVRPTGMVGSSDFAFRNLVITFAPASATIPRPCTRQAASAVVACTLKHIPNSQPPSRRAGTAPLPISHQPPGLRGAGTGLIPRPGQPKRHPHGGGPGPGPRHDSHPHGSGSGEPPAGGIKFRVWVYVGVDAA